MKYSDHVRIVGGFYDGRKATVIGRRLGGLFYEVHIETARTDYHLPWYVVPRWRLRLDRSATEPALAPLTTAN
jgi:hypothetical protein